MKTMSSEEVIRKIQALLALSNSPNENEAKLAATKAAELITNYNVDLLDLEKKTGRAAEDSIQVACYEASFTSGWRCFLASAVSGANYCKYYVDNTEKSAETRAKLGPRYKGTKWTRLMIYGRRTNVEAAVRMFQYLEPAVMRLGAEAMQEYKAECLADGERDNYNSWADSWRKGCTMRLRQRLDDKRREMEAEGVADDEGVVRESTGIAIRDMSLVRDEEAKQWLESVGIELHSAAATTIAHGSGYRAGQRAGDSISLNAQLGSGR